MGVCRAQSCLCAAARTPQTCSVNDVRALALIRRLIIQVTVTLSICSCVGGVLNGNHSLLTSSVKLMTPSNLVSALHWYFFDEGRQEQSCRQLAGFSWQVKLIRLNERIAS